MAAIAMMQQLVLVSEYNCHCTCHCSSIVFSADKRTGRSTRIARQSDAHFEHHADVNLLIYQTSTMLLTVYLTCTDADTDTINARQDDDHTFNIYVQSRCCCPGKCQYSGGSDNNGSIGFGSVFVIIIVVALAIYLIGGSLFLRFQRGASGVNIIPNRLVWLNLVSYAIQGTRYSLTLVCQRTRPANYDNI
jgi:hypothetical protein